MAERRAWNLRLSLVVAAVCLTVPAQAQASFGEPGFDSGRLIVAFDPDLSRAQRGEAIRDEDSSRLAKLPVHGLELVRAQAGVTANQFERRDDVRYAQPDYRVHPSAVPNDPQFGLQWSLQNDGQTVDGSAGMADADIDAPEAWELTTGSSSIVVAIVDTGVALEHPDLAGNVWTNTAESPNGVDDDHNGFVDDVRGWDFVEDDNDPDDLNGHGTHVAGNVGAVGGNDAFVTGVNQDVSLMPVRAAGVDGTGTTGDLISGMAYAARNGASVANVSFDIRGPAFQDFFNQHPETLYTLSAGNDEVSNDGTDLACNTPAPNVVCVAASTQADGLASFSSFGVESVELAAPGTKNLSTSVSWPLLPLGPPEYETEFAQGTSFAAPIVAGVAALAKAFEPTATAAELRMALVGAVDPVPALSGVVASGGRVNARRTIELANKPPETQIDSGPEQGAVVRPHPVFSFIADSAASFYCSIDRAQYFPCEQSFKVPNLDDGAHHLRVLAVDGLGAVDLSPAQRDFTITRLSCRGRLPTIVGSRVTMGTARDDVIAAGPKTRRISGGAGADLLCGGKRGEILVGGPGADVIFGGRGVDSLFGGGGRDRCHPGPGRNQTVDC